MLRKRAQSSEVVLPTKEGTLYKQGSSKKDKDGGNWKKRWFVLIGSTLSYYDSHKKSGTVRTHQIYDGSVTPIPDPKKKTWAFRVHTSEAELMLRAKDEPERLEWIDAITIALGLAPAEDRHIQGARKRNLSLSFRAERKAASRALKTKKGRSLLRSNIPEDSLVIPVIDACVAFVRADLGSTQADEMEKHFFQLTAKTIILTRYDLLDPELADEAVPYIHRICELVERVGERVDDADIHEIADCFDVLSVLSQNEFSLHVSAKMVSRGRALLDYVQDTDRLKRLFTDPTHADEARIILQASSQGRDELGDNAARLRALLPATPVHVRGPLAVQLPHLAVQVEHDGSAQTEMRSVTERARTLSMASQPSNDGFEALDDSASPQKSTT